MVGVVVVMVLGELVVGCARRCGGCFFGALWVGFVLGGVAIRARIEVVAVVVDVAAVAVAVAALGIAVGW